MQKPPTKKTAKKNPQGRIIPYLLVGIAALMPFYRLIFDTNRVLLDRDLALVYLPTKTYWAQSVLKYLHIPEWNPFIYAGTPMVAEANLATLYPLNLLFLIFKPENALTYYVIAHYIFIALGCLFLFQTLRIQRLTYLLLLPALTWGGYSMSSINLPHLLVGAAATFWFWGCWLRYLKQYRTIYLILSSTALAWPIYGGDPQFTYLLALSVLAHALLRKDSFKIKLKSTFTLAFISILLSMAQLLPTIDFIHLSTRASGARLHEIQLNSLHPIRLIELFFGNFFGNYVPENTYWGQQYLSTFIRPFIFSSYIGAFSLFTMICGFFITLKTFSLKQPRLSAFLKALLVAVILLLTLGVHSPIPIYKFFIDWMPLWKMFRYPERLLFWLTLCLIILQADILRKLFLHLQLRSKTSLQAICFGFAATMLISLYLSMQDFPAIAKESIKNTSAIVAMAFAIMLLLQQKILRTKIAKALLIALVFLDMGGHALSLIWDQPKDILNIEHYPHLNQAKEALEKNPDGWKIGAPFRTTNAYFLETSMERLQLLTGLDHIGRYIFAHIESLSGNSMNIFGLYNVGGYLTLYSDTKNLLADTFTNREKLFDLSSVRFRPRRDASAFLIWKESNKRLKSTLPYFYFPEKIYSAPNQKEAMLLAQNASLSSSYSVLETPIHANNSSIENITLTKREPDLLTFSLRATGASDALLFFVIHESYDPHWRLIINNQSYPPMRVNGWAMGFAFPHSAQGSQIMNLKYSNTWFKLGYSLTALGLLISMLMLFCSKPTLNSFYIFTRR